MASVVTSYTQDGEYAYIKTGGYVGDLWTIEPPESDLAPAFPPPVAAADSRDIVNLDETEGWVPLSSERGTFSFYIPAAEGKILEDWSLELHGLPRMHDRLNRPTVVRVLGEEALAAIDDVYLQAMANRESLGDLRAVQRERGPLSTTNIQDLMYQMRSFTSEAGDLNRLTAEARSQLLINAQIGAGRLVVARNVLITD